jgi:[protein-PII] uridylyltransferase
VNIGGSPFGRLNSNGTVREVDTGTLRQRRSALLEDTAQGGIAFCRAYARAADDWLRAIASSAGGSQPTKVALLAVGGYGRGELSPYSDLDLLLVHDGHRKVKLLADQLWYPVWDEGVRLDHSVRSPKEVFAVAEGDLRVALGLLDARMIWGDPAVADPLIEKVRALWATRWGDLWLPELEHQMVVRHEMHGDLADLLEPDLKEAHGGLRDVNVLAAVRCAYPEVNKVADFDEVFRARDVLLEARVALHAQAGRELDRLLLQEQDQVARRVGAVDADALMREISGAARVVARTSDAAWRHRGQWRRRGGGAPEPARAVEDGVELYDGEVRLSTNAPVTTDVTLTMRLAAVAAEQDRPLSFESLVRLAADAPAVPIPWPPALLTAFVRLLGTGGGLVLAVESLDAHGLFTRHLPEWRFVRSYHQRNAYHRFTVDRHLLEAVLHVRAALGEVSRPDLLLLAALFHDIGKGHPGDHTHVGIELVQAIGPRLGLRDDDTATLVQLVRHHLLLSDVATRRDLDDPATIRYVAGALGDEQTLELLAALSRADGLATGASAWGPWKAQLVEELSSRVRRALQGHDLVVEARHDQDLFAEVATSSLVVRREGDWVIVATADQPGLLATITAALATLAIDIRSADVLSADGVAIDRFYCVPGPRGWPEDEALAGAVQDGLADPSALAARLATRAATYATRRRSAHRVATGAHVLPAASESSTVVEVIALDEVGLLTRLAGTVAELGFDIAAARLSTVGDVAIDTFYLRASGPRHLDEAELARLLERLNAEVLAGTASA